MIARTGYLVSSIAYVTFLALNWVRPGFVANVFSPHLFLLAAIIFGFLWARHLPKHQTGAGWMIVLLLPLSLFLAIFAWTEGRPLGDLRILVTLATVVVPWMVFTQLLKRS